MERIIPNSEDAAMDPWMQGLYPSIHELRMPGKDPYFNDRDVILF
jgi:hypothetical protein